MSEHAQPPTSPEPYPDLVGALMLTLFAMLAAALVGVAFIGLGTLAAVGVGQAIGVGAVATIAARRVPEPQTERLGLRGFEPRMLPLILCLIPAVLVASELDNIAWELSDHDAEAVAEELAASDAESESGENGALEKAAEEPRPSLIDFEDPMSVMQATIVIVGISPVVEEFLFRGVIQQGLVARLGFVRGLSLVALLWTLLRPAPITDIPRLIAAGIASFLLGWGLGIVRIATGSVLASILLASSWSAIGLAALALEGRFDLVGMNVEGSHLPIPILVASLALVAWSGHTLYHEARIAADRPFAGSHDPATAHPHDGHGD